MLVQGNRGDGSSSAEAASRELAKRSVGDRGGATKHHRNGSSLYLIARSVVRGTGSACTYMQIERLLRGLDVVQAFSFVLAFHPKRRKRITRCTQRSLHGKMKETEFCCNWPRQSAVHGGSLRTLKKLKSLEWCHHLCHHHWR
jgi:hypothetical protein